MPEMSKVGIEQAGTWHHAFYGDLMGSVGQCCCSDGEHLPEFWLTTVKANEMQAQLRDALAYKALAERAAAILLGEVSLPNDEFFTEAHRIARGIRALSASSEAGAGEEAKDGI